MKTLAIFPLNIVLFPDSDYNLHIFENRYKRLINHCYDTGEAFGIILSNKVNEHSVGTNAKVKKILKKYDDGRMDIIVRGKRRFEIKGNIQTQEDFRVIEAIDYKDMVYELDNELLENCVEYYNEIAEMVVSMSIEKILLNKISTSQPSYYIAQKSGLKLEDKQKLLEMRYENKRLQFLDEHLRKILPVLKKTNDMSKIVKNDGYFNYSIG